MHVRDAMESDAAACAAIYAPYVRDTAITFELEPPTDAEMADRIAAAQQHHAWFVADDDGAVVGYAYGGLYKTRPAYRWTSEVTIYLAETSRGRGVGRLLYEALLARLRDRGLRMLIGVVAVPNEPSERLHAAMGFTPAGTLRDMGWKHGAWHDSALWQLAIGDPVDPPAEPR